MIATRSCSPTTNVEAASSRHSDDDDDSIPGTYPSLLDRSRDVPQRCIVLMMMMMSHWADVSPGESVLRPSSRGRLRSGT